MDRDVDLVGPLCADLRIAGFVVSATANRAFALGALRQRPPHLLLIDWESSTHGGLEVIEAARAANPPYGVGFVILSALSSEQDVVSGLGLGADDYIAKPYSRSEAVARVRAVLRARARRPGAAWHQCAAAAQIADRTGLRELSPDGPRLRVPVCGTRKSSMRTGKLPVLLSFHQMFNR